MIATLASAATLPLLGMPLDRLSTVVVAAATIVMLAAATALMGLASSIFTLLAALGSALVADPYAKAVLRPIR
jgi:hypothetical protein